jgi:hypothetical protein
MWTKDVIEHFCLLLGGFVGIALCSPSWAQEGELSRLYGSGVHNYFAGNHAQAIDILSDAVSAGSNDPRVYYFRGLAHLAMRNAKEANQDFQTGSVLEFSGQGRVFAIGQSLERVQGTNRKRLESFRAEARVAAARDFRRRQELRYGVRQPAGADFSAPAEQSPVVQAQQQTPAAATRSVAGPDLNSRSSLPPSATDVDLPEQFRVETLLDAPSIENQTGRADTLPTDAVPDSRAAEGGTGTVSLSALGRIFGRTLQGAMPRVSIPMEVIPGMSADDGDAVEFPADDSLFPEPGREDPGLPADESTIIQFENIPEDSDDAPSNEPVIIPFPGPGEQNNLPTEQPQPESQAEDVNLEDLLKGIEESSEPPAPTNEGPDAP